MLKSLSFHLVTSLLVVLTAQPNRAEALDIICTNVEALNSQFVSLMAQHLDFEPSVMINPNPQDSGHIDPVRTVRLVISGSRYEAVVACARAFKFGRDDLEQRIQKLRRQLGSGGNPIFADGPSGKVLTTEKAFEMNGRQLFISVSNEADLIAAGAAVAQSHNINSQTCWFDNACRDAAEKHWLMRSR